MWIESEERIMTENQFVSLRNFLEKICPYRMDNFCDGTPNKSVSRYIHEKEPCQYFKNGKFNEI